MFEFLLKFVSKGQINDIPALVQIMAWRRPGDKPLSEPMMVSLTTHICVTRLQWVNESDIFLNRLKYTMCWPDGDYVVACMQCFCPEYFRRDEIYMCTPQLNSCGRNHNDGAYWTCILADMLQLSKPNYLDRFGYQLWYLFFGKNVKVEHLHLVSI